MPVLKPLVLCVLEELEYDQKGGDCVPWGDESSCRDVESSEDVSLQVSGKSKKSRFHGLSDDMGAYCAKTVDDADWKEVPRDGVQGCFVAPAMQFDKEKGAEKSRGTEGICRVDDVVCDFPSWYANITAGRAVPVSAMEIMQTLEKFTFAKQKSFVNFINIIKEKRGVCHILGVLSAEDNFSYQKTVMPVVHILCDAGIRTALHIFLADGAGEVGSGLRAVINLQNSLENYPKAFIATVAGAYYADDKRKDIRAEKAIYDAIVNAEAPRFADAEEAAIFSYQQKLFDEFMKPVAIGDYDGIDNGDGLCILNFDEDWAVHLLEPLLLEEFDGFHREKEPVFSAKIALRGYTGRISGLIPAMFSGKNLPNVLGKVISDAGIKQLKIFEDKQYRNMTYFFNGMTESVFCGEERKLVSLKTKEETAYEGDVLNRLIKEEVLRAIDLDEYDVIVSNYVGNKIYKKSDKDVSDNVGGKNTSEKNFLNAECCDFETYRVYFEEILQKLLERKGTMVIIVGRGKKGAVLGSGTGSDTSNGNGFKEKIVGNGMEKGTVDFGYIVSDTKMMVVDYSGEVKTLANMGKLADIAPTVLDILKLEKSFEMTGVSLLAEN